MRSRGSNGQVLVIKPVRWRHSGFTLFLFLCGVFFAFIDYLGLIASWIGTVVLCIAGILSLLDQLFEWSRLRIDDNGFHLRGWWRKLSFRHQEIKGFEMTRFANRSLITLVLKAKAQEQRGLNDPYVAFPCSFGRPPDEVIATLKSSLKIKKL